MSNQLVAIEHAIKQGDAFLDKADSYREQREHHERKERECRKSAGLSYAEAQDICQRAGLFWTEECKAITTRSMRDVQKVIKIARAADPDAALEEERVRNAGYSQTYRNNMGNAADVAAVSRISRISGVDFTEEVPLRTLDFDPIAFDESLVAPMPDELVPEVPDWGAIVRELEGKLAKAEARIVELETELGEVELERDRMQDRVEEFEQKLINFQNIGGALPRRRPAKPEPVSLRVARAVELFFELPAAKHLWVKQRMAEPPQHLRRSTGPHVDWIQTFWQCSEEEQDAIREQIKITEQRNAG